MIVDLHCHSTASDGTLAPLQLAHLAQESGVDILAITDHDTVDGYLEIRDQWAGQSMRLLSGVELSCQWSGRLIHVVGININVDDKCLQQRLTSQQQAREERAHLIDERLAKRGFPGGYAYAKELAGKSPVGRPHFARFLVDKGHVASEAIAFKRYLGAGKVGDVKLTWPALSEVVEWIASSGGIAILAHPLHYNMTATKLRALVSDFKVAGGLAIEVISGKQAADRTQYIASLAQQFGLSCSVGSDFHKPDVPWRNLGNMGSLPRDCSPVWLSLIDERVQ